MKGVDVVVHPRERQAYLDQVFLRDGISGINEDVNAAYCPISLTTTPAELKQHVRSRQQHLMKEVLTPVGINAYDPESAPLSPDRDLSTLPFCVYATDAKRIAHGRFFVGHNLLPSTGVGVEIELAKSYNRIAVLLNDRNIRISRMQPPRIIQLQYENFGQQTDDFRKVFELLKGFTPGMGRRSGVPVLIGQDAEGTLADLEELVAERFPSLKYAYDGTRPTVGLVTSNPDIFYENRP